MVWNGEALTTLGELMSAALAVMRAGDKEEGKRFMREYADVCDNGMETARANIGYASGYYDPKTMVDIQEFFDTSHPIFGRSVPTPEEALEAGKKMGEKMKNG